MRQHAIICSLITNYLFETKENYQFFKFCWNRITEFAIMMASKVKEQGKNMVRTGKTLLTMLAIFTVQNAEVNSMQDLIPNNLLYKNKKIWLSENSAFQRNAPQNDNGNSGVHNLINLTEEKPKFVVHMQQPGKKQYENAWYFENKELVTDKNDENLPKNSKKVSNRIGRFKSKHIKIYGYKFILKKKFSKEICEALKNSDIGEKNVKIPTGGLFLKNTKLWNDKIRKLERAGLIEYLEKTKAKITENKNITLSRKDIFHLFTSVLYTGEYPPARTRSDTKDKKKCALRKKRGNLKIRKSDGSVDLRLIEDTIASFSQFRGHFSDLIVSANTFPPDQLLRANAKSVLNTLTEIARLAVLCEEIYQETTFSRETIMWHKKKHNRRIRGIKDSKFEVKNTYLIFKVKWNEKTNYIRKAIKELLEKAIDESCNTFVNKFQEVLTTYSTELMNKNINNKNDKSELSEDETIFLNSLDKIKEKFQEACTKGDLKKISVNMTLPANNVNPNPIEITSLAELFKKKLKPLIDASMDQIASSYKKELISDKQTENTQKSE